MNVKFLYIFFPALFVFVFFVLPFSAGAGILPLVQCTDNCTICGLVELLDRIIDFLIYYIAIPGAGIMIAVGGFMMLIGAGSESRVGAGKKMITNAIVGIIIVLAGWLIVDTVIKALTGGKDQFIGTFGTWNAPKCSF